MPTSRRQAELDAIERDRRKRELILLAIFATQFRTAQRFAASSVRLGHDPTQAVGDVLAGNSGLELSGLAAPLADVMNDAWQAGMRRATRLTGEEGELDVPSYQASAAVAVADIYREAQIRVSSAVLDAANKDSSVRDTVAAVRQAVIDRGWGGDDPYAADAFVQSQVVKSYGAGMMAVYRRGRPGVGMLLEFLTARDEAVCPICEPLDATVLPASDQFWMVNAVPLHPRCRCFVLPARGVSTGEAA